MFCNAVGRKTPWARYGAGGAAVVACVGPLRPAFASLSPHRPASASLSPHPPASARHGKPQPASARFDLHRQSWPASALQYAVIIQLPRDLLIGGARRGGTFSLCLSTVSPIPWLLSSLTEEPPLLSRQNGILRKLGATYFVLLALNLT